MKFIDKVLNKVFKKINNNIEIKDSNISRKFKHENRINDAIEKGKDLRAKHIFLNNLF